MRRLAKPTAVYMSIAAQSDNLGDIVIRRNLVRWLCGTSARLHLVAEGMPCAYVDAFDLPPGVVLHRRTSTWLASLLRDVAIGRAMLVYAPGPQGLEDTTKALVRGLGNTLLSLLCSSAGKGVLVIGRAYRGEGPLAGAMARLVVRRSRLAALRDNVSSSIVGADNATVYPDLGILPEPGQDVRTGTTSRRILALSIRSDRELPSNLIPELVDYADQNQLRIVFVTQVRRDEECHLSLSSKVPGSEVVRWAGSHKEQLQRVLEVYRSASVVVSNRLHGLLLGWSQGAQPVPLVDAHDSKLLPTLASIGAALNVADGTAPVGGVLTRAVADSEISESTLLAGLERLDVLRELVQQAVEGAPGRAAV